MTIFDEIIENFNVTNFYDVLQVSKDATKDEIKKAYLQRSLQWHPDKVEDPIVKAISSKKFQVLTQIYQILSDSKRRRDYDGQLHDRTGVNEDLDSFARYDEVRLNECLEQDDFYCYDCRCSGRFLLSKKHLLSTRAHPTNFQNVFIVDCDSCSNTIKITL
jgi:DnaJ-class molecular chaperone